MRANKVWELVDLSKCEKLLRINEFSNTSKRANGSINKHKALSQRVYLVRKGKSRGYLLSSGTF